MRLADAVQLMGGHAIASDISYDAREYIVIDSYFESWLRIIATGAILYLWLGFHCESFTALWAWC